MENGRDCGLESEVIAPTNGSAPGMQSEANVEVAKNGDEVGREEKTSGNGKQEGAYPSPYLDEMILPFLVWDRVLNYVETPEDIWSIGNALPFFAYHYQEHLQSARLSLVLSLLKTQCYLTHGLNYIQLILKLRLVSKTWRRTVHFHLHKLTEKSSCERGLTIRFHNPDSGSTSQNFLDNFRATHQATTSNPFAIPCLSLRLKLEQPLSVSLLESLSLYGAHLQAFTFYASTDDYDWDRDEHNPDFLLPCNESLKLLHVVLHLEKAEISVVKRRLRVEEKIVRLLSCYENPFESIAWNAFHALERVDCQLSIEMGQPIGRKWSHTRNYWRGWRRNPLERVSGT